MSDESWLNDLEFLTDITHHLSKLQFTCQLVNKLFEHICAFEKKVELFQVQFGSAILINFTCLAARKTEFPGLDSTNYAASVQELYSHIYSQVLY